MESWEDWRATYEDNRRESRYKVLVAFIVLVMLAFALLSVVAGAMWPVGG